MKVTGGHVHSSWGKSPEPASSWQPGRSYMRAKQNCGLLLREKQGRQLSTCVSKPLTAQRCGHRLHDWTSNHGTIERKISNRSRIWSAAGWCPAATMPPDANSMYLKERLLISLNPQKFFLARSNAKSHNFFIWVVMFNLTIFWVRENLANIRRPIIH